MEEASSSAPWRILVVDDEEHNRDLLRRILRPFGAVTAAASGSEALELLRTEPFRVVVSDHRMPGLSGVELLERAARLAPETERILVSGYGDVDVLTDAINRGHISHFLAKPIEIAELERIVRVAVGRSDSSDLPALVLAAPDRADAIVAALRGVDVPAALVSDFGLGDPDEAAVWPTQVSARVVDEVRRCVRGAARRQRSVTQLGQVELIGRSAAMQSVYDTIDRVASTQATVLLRGETGTGKEMVARVLHSLSPRRERPFVAVNCAALPESLVESELFGHERGAFTGAASRKLGRFERADGGTLFVDEIGEVPPAVQVKLLRVLQERSFERVGGTDSQHVDIRLIAATNRELEAALERGTFREDLYYRLNVVPIYLPPLRERREDIPLLAAHFLAHFQERLGKEGVRLSTALRERMLAHDWPGNVRELMNVVERAVALTPSGEEADLESLQVRRPRERLRALAPERGDADLRTLVGDFEKRVIAQALERQDGNRTRTARDLGITRQGLSLKIKKYGL